MKFSLVITVLNEESKIISLLNSIAKQSMEPDEVIIVDGGSTDNTLSVISNFNPQAGGQISNKKTKFKLLKKIGNRAVGRNEGIQKAKNEIIAITDAGCILDINWLKKITTPFKDKKIEIVSGYYKVLSRSVFEKCVGIYVLVMPDSINPQEFLPSSRSMSLRKKIWKEAGGFPEKFSLNEDYVFAIKLKKLNKKIHFARNAIVSWMPRSTIKNAFLMFFQFARGDAQAAILRPKVIFIFIRYGLGFIIFLIGLINKNVLYLAALFLVLYLIWAIYKNFHYVKKAEALYILPILQIICDIAVISGTLKGFYEQSKLGKDI